MMALTLRASNGLELTAEASEWIVGLVLLLDDAQKARLIDIVAGMAKVPRPSLLNGIKTQTLLLTDIKKETLQDGTQVTLINGATRL